MAECKACFREMTFVRSDDGKCPYCVRIAELEAENARLAAIVRQIVMEDNGRYVLTELGVRRLEAVEAAASASARDLQGGE